MNFVSILAVVTALVACDRSSSNPPAPGVPGPVVGNPMGGTPQNYAPNAPQNYGQPPAPNAPQNAPQNYGQPPAPNAPQNYGQPPAQPPSQAMPNGAPPSGEYADEYGDEGNPPPNGAPPNGAPNAVPPNGAPPNAAPPSGGQTFDLKPIRTFDALDPNATLTADGDYMAWKAYSRNGETCGALYKTTPFEAIFLICTGHLIAGPLTDPEKIRGAMADMQQQTKAYFTTKASMSEFANNLRRNMQVNWPSGCSNCNVRVYDANGNWLRDERN